MRSSRNENEEPNMKIQITTMPSESRHSRSGGSFMKGEKTGSGGHNSSLHNTCDRSSFNSSSGEGDFTGKPETPYEKECHDYQHNDTIIMPSIKRSSSTTSSHQINTHSGSNGGTASPSVSHDREAETHITRGSTAVVDAARGRSSTKVVLPHLASAQSLHSSRTTPDPSLTPTISSAPSVFTKPATDGADSGKSKIHIDLTLMKRSPVTDPTLATLQPLKKSSFEFHRSSASAAHDGTNSKGESFSPDARSPFVHPAFALPVRIATKVSMPEVKTAETPVPIFSAEESVPKRPCASFRLQKRRKGAADNTARNSCNSSTEGAAALPPKCSALDMTRKERQANGGDGGSSNGKRREPVAGFINVPDQSSQRPSISVFSGAHNVLPLPLMSTDELVPYANKSPKLCHHHRDGDADDTDNVDCTPSVRRSFRSSMRIQTSHSASSTRNPSFSSNDDLPRPLTRHASTLSNGQREALKKTPSFRSRVHTPPPSDFRESLQLRRVRRPSTSERLSAGTPPLSNTRSKTDTSLTSDFTMMISGFLSPTCEDHRIAGFGKRNVVDASLMSPSPLWQGEKDMSTTNISSLSSSTMSVAVRPPSRTLRALTTNTPDLKATALSSTLIGGSGITRVSSPPSSSEVSSSVPVAQPSSGRAFQQRHRQDLQPKSGLPLSTSPEPPTTENADPARPSGVVQIVSSPSIDPSNHAGSNCSVLSSTSESADYSGYLMLSSPQLDHTSNPLPPTSPPLEETTVGATTTTPTEKSTAKTNTDTVRFTPTPNANAKNGFVNSSFSSEHASMGDLLTYALKAPESAQTSTVVGPSTSPKAERGVTASPSKAVATAVVSSPGHARRVRPASRQRQISTYVNGDGDDIYQMPRDNGEDSGNLTGKAKDPSAKTDATSSRYGCLLDTGGLVDTAADAAAAPASSEALTPINAPVLANKLIAQPLPANLTMAAPTALIKLLSSDDDEDADEEEEEGLLEGFRPAVFDATRNRRRGSSILFFLDKEDSLSSLDVMVKPGSDRRTIAAPVIAPPFEAAKPQSSQQSSKPDYSVSKISTSAMLSGASAKNESGNTATQPSASSADALARPRVTMEPYVPLGSIGAPSSTLPAPPVTAFASTRVDGTVSQSLSIIDPYGLHLDRSNLSLPAGAVKPMKDAPKSSTTSWKPTVEAPVSIFLGTTSRFAPDPKKMHRPIANTFGYTSEQRRARAAAMAAGLSLETWENAAAIDDEADIYKEVYTDENGDEWCWEEVEEDEEDCEDDVEETEEVEGCRDARRKGNPVVHKAPCPTNTGAVATA